jgi:Tfp pilus assembly PilM family ATPase
MTQSVAKALGLSAKAAEVHKCEHGIAAPAQREMRDEAHRSELPSLMMGALRGELTEIAAEIKRSYEYVLRCYTGKTAGDLVLTGSGAMMHNLPEFYSQALGISVQRASAYLGGAKCRINVQSGVRAPIEMFAVAIGAALEAGHAD